MGRRPEPVFLERQSYRRRRLGDAAKFLPFVGLVLFLLPHQHGPLDEHDHDSSAAHHEEHT